MVEGRKVVIFSGAGLLRACVAGALLGVCHVPFAFAEGGQTEITKTVPANPPAPPAQAPAQPAPPPAAATKPVSPVGAGPAWQTQTNAAQAATTPAAALQESDQQIVTKVNAYFNKLADLQGIFLQTDPDGKQRRGRFYFQRPGKIRFDYAPPSGLRIVSDGRYLAIEDREMNTSEHYPLDVTPFKLLLSETVDLANDAKVTSIEQGPDTYVLTVEEKTADNSSSGRIRLFMTKSATGDVSLKEWIITDAQGLDTRIEVSELDQTKKLAENFFMISPTLGIDHDR